MLKVPCLIYVSILEVSYLLALAMVAHREANLKIKESKGEHQRYGIFTFSVSYQVHTYLLGLLMVTAISFVFIAFCHLGVVSDSIGPRLPNHDSVHDTGGHSGQRESTTLGDFGTGVLDHYRHCRGRGHSQRRVLPPGEQRRD